MSNMMLSSAGIAIIGMSGRFPEAATLDSFWHHLCIESDSTTGSSDQETVKMDADPILLNGSDYGDTVSTTNTERQQYLFLQCAWEALEQAGYDPTTYKGSIGVYSSTIMSTHILLQLFSFYGLGGESDRLPISYPQPSRPDDKNDVVVQSDIVWPRVTIQSSYAHALMTIHAACQSLRSGECDIALAGGFSTDTVHKNPGDYFRECNTIAPEAEQWAKSTRPNGHGKGFGSTIGIFILKRIEDAQANSDQIYAVIRGSEIDSTAALTSQLTLADSTIEDRADSIARLLGDTGVAPETISYVEVQAIESDVPGEIAALSRALGANMGQQQCCSIGVTRPYTAQVAGTDWIAGLFKVVLALFHKQVPPNKHATQLNTLEFANSPFSMHDTLTEWGTGPTLRRASVSMLQTDGVHAQFLLEEATPAEVSHTSRSEHIIMLSAMTRTALEAITSNLVNHLKQHPEHSLADVAYTLQLGRRAFNYRRMLVCHDRDETVVALESRDPKRVLTQYHEPAERPIIFMFPGQGTQYVNMGAGLYQTEEIFRAHVDHCAAILLPHLERDIREILYPTIDKLQTATQELKQTRLAQPALFVIETAMAQLWMAWGIHPHAMIGHSLGEYVAAYLAGVFTLEDALALVAARGQLLRQTPTGAMLSIPLSARDVTPFLSEQISIAAINEPTSCVVAGTVEAVHTLEQRLNARGYACRRLPTTRAFHSVLLDSIAQPFRTEVEKINLRPPTIPYLSNVTGTWMVASDAQDPDYWVQQLRQTVLFADGMQRLLQEPKHVFLEVGPGRTLNTFTRYHPACSSEQLILSSMRHPMDHETDINFLLTKIGRLWLAGVSINWAGFHAGEHLHRLPLPTYPIEHEHVAVEPSHPEDLVTPRHPIGTRRPDPADWFYLPVWKQTLPLQPMHMDTSVSWLLFVDDVIGPYVAQRLEQLHQHVITVELGTHFQAVSAKHYRINPGAPNDYRSLIDAIGHRPTTIIHCWGITPRGAPKAIVERLTQSQTYGFGSLLFLVQALGPESTATPLRISVVSNNMQHLAGEPEMFPEKATVLGVCRSLSRNNVGMICQSVDLQIPAIGSWQMDRLIDQLVTECFAQPVDPVVAYRDGRRWIQTHEAMRLDTSTTPKIVLQEEDVYLVIGSLTRTGSTLIEYLTLTVGAKVALIIPSALPDRAIWSHWLATNGEDDETSRILRRVLSLESTGVEMVVIGTDMTNRCAMDQTLDHIHTILGPIDGAFILGDNDGETPLISPSSVEVMRYVKSTHARLLGLSVLAELLPADRVKFCFVESPIGAVLGDDHNIVCTAVGCFAAALSQWETYHSIVPWINVNWEHWSHTPTTPFCLTSEEGIVTLSRMLAWGMTSQVVISPGDLLSRLEWHDQQQTKETRARAEPPAISPTHSLLHIRPLPSSYIAPRDDLEFVLADIWQSVLGIDRIGIHDSFADLGGNLATGIEIAAKMSERGWSISPKQLFDHNTIATLAAHVGTSA